MVRFEEVQIPAQFLGKNYEQDTAYRQEFQGWINQQWLDKDALLETLHREYPARP